MIKKRKKEDNLNKIHQNKIKIIKLILKMKYRAIKTIKLILQ